MTKRLALGLLVGALEVGVGCGSDPPKQFRLCGTDGYVCDTSGIPFAGAVVADDDYCGGLVADCMLPLPAPTGATTANLTKQGGQVCLSGFLGTGGWALLALPFATWTDDLTAIVKSFDASALGIAQVEFTIDSPLTGGVTVGATTSPPAPVDCHYGSCFSGFKFGTAPLTGIAAELTAPGPEVVPFANLYQIFGDASSFDPVALEDINFAPSQPGDYAFCISDIRFRDAAGNEVKP
jgi:hypothetical protein